MKIKNRKFTWKKEPVDKRDIKYQIKLGVTLPNEIDLRDKCSVVEDQLDMGSCVFNASVGNMEFLDIVESGEYTDLSRLFAYYNTRVIENSVNEDAGAYIRDAIKSLSKDGTCIESMWKYEKSNLFKMPSSVCYADAKTKIITSYQSLSSTKEIQICLAEGFPVIFGMMIYDSFVKVKKDGMVLDPSFCSKKMGGHAMLIVGYKKINNKDYFIVRNSWGEKWGDKGYCYISFKSINKSASDFWTIRK